jgi:hypothetical protein
MSEEQKPANINQEHQRNLVQFWFDTPIIILCKERNYTKTQLLYGHNNYLNLPENIKADLTCGKVVIQYT